jgi:hypothetical protein
MALVMDPITAGALLAPLFCVTDIVAFRYWRSSTWSKPDLMVLIPGLIVGVGAGFLVLRFVDRHFIAIVIALITLLFAGLWFKGGGRIVPRARSRAKGVSAGVASGMGSMIAHSGGPPVAPARGSDARVLCAAGPQRSRDHPRDLERVAAAQARRSIPALSGLLRIARRRRVEAALGRSQGIRAALNDESPSAHLHLKRTPG